ncbi:unnamed protein product [Ambrosiozyma monospora]|uniref:Unnamed protein product n=1 Tax=Ambrosiozyma monospora TaxID=43982 RepID=A0ACB5TBD9_AMBMO|nr:unnamed protein product [Ambrosiozyma monospora]
MQFGSTFLAIVSEIKRQFVHSYKPSQDTLPQDTPVLIGPLARVTCFQVMKRRPPAAEFIDTMIDIATPKEVSISTKTI